MLGLEREAAMKAFADYLDDTNYTVDQIASFHLIVDELTSNGVVQSSRLYESP